MLGNYTHQQVFLKRSFANYDHALCATFCHDCMVHSIIEYACEPLYFTPANIILLSKGAIQGDIKRLETQLKTYFQ